MARRDDNPQKSPTAVWAPATGSASFELFCRTFFTLYAPLKVEGWHHLPKEPFLLCSNHSSHADSAALMTASRRSFREFALLGASDYFFRSTGRLWLLSKLMNIIPIERRPGPRSLSGCLAECRHFLSKNGQVLILYPEGTRSSDGEMQEFKGGVGWLANELRIPIVPTYVEGTHRILPKGRSVPRPYPVSVRFGEAFSWESVFSRANSAHEQRRAFAQHLAWQIRRLMPEPSSQEFVAEIRHKS